MEAVTVFGAGSWGTAVGYLLSKKGIPTSLWGRNAALIGYIDETRRNPEYLPNVKLPKTLSPTADLAQAAARSRLWVLSVPSIAMRQLVQQLKPFCKKGTVVVNLAKGLEADTLHTMSQLLADVLPTPLIYTLSGPSHAEEVGLDYPTSVVIAGQNLAVGKQLQALFMTDRFRPYLSNDLKGVEYGGTVKNVIALAAGALDGLGFGDNAKGALISRGLAEMVRLCVRLGTQRETLFGLSGLGDLVTTCTSQHSRNRAVGEQLGKGRSLKQITNEMNMVAEGVFATKTVRALAHSAQVEMPITEACYDVLYKGSPPLEKLTELMRREAKIEQL